MLKRARKSDAVWTRFLFTRKPCVVCRLTVIPAQAGTQPRRAGLVLNQPMTFFPSSFKIPCSIFQPTAKENQSPPGTPDIASSTRLELAPFDVPKGLWHIAPGFNLGKTGTSLFQVPKGRRQHANDLCRRIRATSCIVLEVRHRPCGAFDTTRDTTPQAGSLGLYASRPFGTGTEQKPAIAAKPIFREITLV